VTTRLTLNGGVRLFTVWRRPVNDYFIGVYWTKLCVLCTTMYASSLAAACWPLLTTPRTGASSKGARGLCARDRVKPHNIRRKLKLPTWLNIIRLKHMSIMEAVIAALSPTLSSYQSLSLLLPATAVYAPRCGFALDYFSIYHAESLPI